MITVDTFVGQEVAPHLDDVARLRIAVFRAFPYLYDGDAGYERRYLETYARAPESLFVLARDGERVVGASTGIPMARETDEVKQPWQRAGIDPAGVFYFGESVLLPEYRGRGLGHRFFDEREGHARTLGHFRRTSFCAVERADDDPRRPHGYRPLHGFWNARGYRRHEDLSCRMRWKEIDSDDEVENRLTFWSRPLDG